MENTENTAAEPQVQADAEQETFQEVVQSDDMILASFMDSRRAELAGLTEEDPEPEAEAEAADSEVESAEAAEVAEEPEAPKETATSAARRAIAREKKILAEREELSKERAQFEADNKESLEKIEEFGRTKARALINPLEHLTSIGLSEDDLLNVAREIYYNQMPDQATPAVQAEMARLKQDRRIKSQTQRIDELEAKKAEPEPEQEQGPTPEQQAFVSEYKANLYQAAATIDQEEFPLAAEYAKGDFNDLVGGMFALATNNARNQNGQGTPLTPAECLERVEAHLRAEKAKETPAVQAQQTEETPPTQSKRAPLRNTNTAARPSDKPAGELTPEEYKEQLRSRFFEKLQEGGVVQR